MNVPRDICKVIIDEQGFMADNLPDTWKQYASKQVKTGEEVDMNNTANMIDCLVLLANSDKLLARMHQIDVDSLIPLIRLPDEGEYWEEVKLRV